MIKKIVTPYFPTGMKFTSPLILGGGIYLMYIGYYAFGIVLLIVGVVILTTNYITEINLTDKYCKDYVSILGLGMNSEVKKFKTLDLIVITKGNYAQTVNTRVQSRQMDWSDYTATLIMDNQDSLDLLTHTDKHDLLVKLKAFTDVLNVDVEDRTTRDPYLVDMSKIQ